MTTKPGAHSVVDVRVPGASPDTTVTIVSGGVVDDPDPNGIELRRALNSLSGEMKKRQRERGELPIGLHKQRGAIGRRLKEVARIARIEHAVALPTVQEAREQMEAAVERVKAAAAIVGRAYGAFKELDDDAFDGLFGGASDLSAAGSTYAVIEARQCYGDPDGPLTQTDFDRFRVQLETMARRLQAARDHALRSRYYMSRRGEGRDRDEWKRNAAWAVMSICRDVPDLRPMIQMTEGGPLHSVINIVVQGIAGIDEPIGKTAFIGAVERWREVPDFNDRDE